MVKKIQTLSIAILLSLATQAPAQAARTALSRLTQDRILTPMPNRRSDTEDCSKIVQAHIQKFYSEDNRQNIDTKNNMLTASVFADSTENSLYGQYIALRLSEKNQIGTDHESRRSRSREFFSSNFHKFFPKEVSKFASYVILDPHGQIEGLGFDSLHAFLDFFDNDALRKLFQAYGMDSLSVSAERGEGLFRDTHTPRKRWDRVLDRLAELATNQGLTKLHLDDFQYHPIMSELSLVGHGVLRRKLEHLSLAFQAPYRTSNNSLELEESSLYSLDFGEIGLDTLDLRPHLAGLSQLSLRSVSLYPESAGLTRYLSKDKLTLFHLSGRSLGGFSEDPVTDLMEFQSLTHLNLTNAGYALFNVDIYRLEELTASLPKLTHFAFTAPQQYSKDALLSIISTFRSPELKEVGITNLMGHDSLVERDALPPIRVVGNEGIHW